MSPIIVSGPSSSSSPALEQFVLDGLALNDHTNFIMQGFDFGVPPKRWQWISGTDSDGAVLPEEAHYDNAEMTLRLRIAPQSSMDNALAQIGQIVDKLQECEQQPLGLAAVWTPAGSTKSLTAYIVGGEVTGIPLELSGDDAGWFLRNPAPVVTIKLYRRPGLYGTEVVAAATLNNSLPYQVITVPNVLGDLPAEARLSITDGASQSRRLVRWGRRWRYYDAATSLYVDSDNMVTTGFAGVQTTRTGAHDPNASGNNVIRATLTTTPVAVCGLGNLGHVGSYRPVLRCWAAPTGTSVNTDFKVRLSYRAGDGPLQALPWVSPVVVNGFSEVELGVINIPPKTLGTQRWTGQIEAYSAVAGDTLDVDYNLLFPTDGYGKARAPAASAVVSTLNGFDYFTGAAGALNTRAAPTGGTWATSGAATDFTGGSDAVSRSISVAGPEAAYGRVAILGATSYTDAVVTVDWSQNNNIGAHYAVIARYVDASNFVYLRFYAANGGTAPYLAVVKVVAGVETILASSSGSVAYFNDTYYTLRLTVRANGQFTATMTTTSTGASMFTLSGADTALATGGTLATGKPGFFHRKIQATTAVNTATFDSFTIGVPAAESIVIYSGRAAEIRHDGAIRQDSTGTYYGDVPSYRGAHFFLQPAGDENRTNEILVEARRNDTDTLADDQIADSTTVTVHYTPRYCVVPR